MGKEIRITFCEKISSHNYVATLTIIIIKHQIHIHVEACVLGKCSVGMKLRYSDE